jgi:ABC-type thiamine transport system ATPase subunit
VLLRQRQRRALSACLVTLPPLCVLLSPYAAELPSSLLRDPHVRRLYRDHAVSLLLVDRAATCS